MNALERHNELQNENYEQCDGNCGSKKRMKRAKLINGDTGHLSSCALAAPHHKECDFCRDEYGKYIVFSTQHSYNTHMSKYHSFLSDVGRPRPPHMPVFIEENEHPKLTCSKDMLRGWVAYERKEKSKIKKEYEKSLEETREYCDRVCDALCRRYLLPSHSSRDVEPPVSGEVPVDSLPDTNEELDSIILSYLCQDRALLFVNAFLAPHGNLSMHDGLTYQLCQRRQDYGETDYDEQQMERNFKDVCWLAYTGVLDDDAFFKLKHWRDVGLRSRSWRRVYERLCVEWPEYAAFESYNRMVRLCVNHYALPLYLIDTVFRFYELGDDRDAAISMCRLKRAQCRPFRSEPSPEFRSESDDDTEFEGI